MENKDSNEYSDEIFEDAKNKYNYEFIIKYPEKLEFEINNIDSNAIKFIAIEGAFIALIITIFFNSLVNHVDKLSEWLIFILQILFNLYFAYTIFSIYYLIKCILVKKYDYYEFILEEELNRDSLSFIYNPVETSKDAKEFSENYTNFMKSLNFIKEHKKLLITKEEYFKIATKLFILCIIIIFIISFISLNLALL